MVTWLSPPHSLNQPQRGKKMKKDLNKLSFSELKTELKNLEERKDKATTKQKGVWQIGKNYVIRTVTMINIGKLVKVTEEELILEDASWIPDTGRWTDFLKEGKYDECEPFEVSVIVGRKSLIDATLWNHALPKNQK